MTFGFFGTSQFGADALELLHATAGVEIAWVVTQLDRPAGRGRTPRPPPVATRARDLGLELIQTDNASATPPAADAAAVVAFGQVLRDPLLHAYPLFNLHPSLLPRWRGAAPVERAIMAGDDTTGVCVIELVEQLDAGPVHAVEQFPIASSDDSGVIRARALELGVPLLAAALRGQTTGVAQGSAGVSYAHKLTADDRHIDWSRPAVEVDRLVRALAPDVGARSQLDGRPVVIWRGTAGDRAGGAPGQVVAAPLTLACGDGSYDVLDLQPAGKRRMTAEEYLRGLRAPPQRAGE